MIKKILIALVLLASTAAPLITQFSHNYKPTQHTQHTAKIKLTQKTPPNNRQVRKFAPDMGLSPSKKESHIKADTINKSIDIGINPFQKHGQDNYFKFQFYLKKKLITAKDKSLFTDSGKAVTQLKERSKGDLFIKASELKNLGVKLLIPSQSQEKITLLSLLPDQMKKIKAEVNAGKVNYQSIQLYFVMHGIAVSPHADFHMNWTETGNGTKKSYNLGSFNVYNMDKATRLFFTSKAGLIFYSILMFLIVLTTVLVFNFLSFEIEPLLLQGTFAAIRGVLGVIKSSLLSALTYSAIIGAVIYVTTGLITDSYLFETALPSVLAHRQYPHVQSDDPNKPNYQKYTHFSQNKYLFLHGDTSGLLPWNRGDTKLFDKMFGDREDHRDNEQQTHGKLGALNKNFWHTQNNNWNSNYADNWLAKGKFWQ